MFSQHNHLQFISTFVWFKKKRTGSKLGNKLDAEKKHLDNYRTNKSLWPVFPHGHPWQPNSFSGYFPVAAQRTGTSGVAGDRKVFLSAGAPTLGVSTKMVDMCWYVSIHVNTVYVDISCCDICWCVLIYVDTCWSVLIYEKKQEKTRKERREGRKRQRERRSWFVLICVDICCCDICWCVLIYVDKCWSVLICVFVCWYVLIYVDIYIYIEICW